MSEAFTAAKARLNEAITRWLAGDDAARSEVEQAMREAERLRQESTHAD